MGQKKEDIDRIAKYLLDATPSPTSRELYQRAVAEYCHPLQPREARLWNIAMNHPILLPYIDAGLGLTNKLGAVRERIYVAFAILETETALAEKFIYSPKAFWLFRSAFYVLRGIVRAIIGRIVVAFI